MGQLFKQAFEVTLGVLTAAAVAVIGVKVTAGAAAAAADKLAERRARRAAEGRQG